VRAYTHEELLALAPGYAMGALNADETAAVEHALATSPEIAAEVRAYHDVMATMAQGEAVMPSPDVRARLLEAIRRDAPKLNGARAPAAGLHVLRAPPRSRSRWRAWGVPSSLAASLVLAAGLAYQNVALRRQLRTAAPDAAAVRSRLEKREHTLNTLLHGEKDLYVVHLKAADTVRGPGVQVFWNERHRAGVLHAFRLPPAPRGRAYQLWAIVAGRPVASRVFNSDPDGHALVEQLELPRTTAGATEMAITMEPAGGSAAPTGTVVMRGVVPRL
jgi:anti-sigma-K factor RskA